MTSSDPLLSGDSALRSTSDVLSDVESLFASIPVPILVADGSGRVVLANGELLELFGYRADELLGKPVEVLVPEAMREVHRGHREAFHREPRARRMGQAIELSARRQNGASVPVEVALKPLPASDGHLVLAVVFDLTVRKGLEEQLRQKNRELERRVAERTLALERRNQEMVTLLDSLERARNELERLSREDSLTGLLNRREFFARSQAEIRRAGRHGHPTAVAMLDIDHFKRVNDEYGHGVGDIVLHRIAQLMRGQCRLDDVLARFGGEEFALLLPETGLADAAGICERIRKAIEMHDWGAEGAALPITVSAGLIHCRVDEGEAEALVRADRLLYRAKALGRNRTCSEAEFAV